MHRSRAERLADEPFSFRAAGIVLLAMHKSTSLAHAPNQLTFSPASGGGNTHAHAKASAHGSSSKDPLAGFATAALLLIAILWGSTLFAIKDLLNSFDPADLSALRFTMTALAMLVALLITQRLKANKIPRAQRQRQQGTHLLRREHLWQGTILGALFASGQLAQTFGLTSTSASTSGFLTGMYVVATPLLEALLLRRNVASRVWLAAALATGGLAVLTFEPGAGFSFGSGEWLTALGALMFASHIIATARYANRSNIVQLGFVQSLVLAAASIIAALPGGIMLPSRAGDWWAIAYLGVICGAVTILAQTWAQARVNPSRAAVIMSSEPVWGAMFAILVGQEFMTWQVGIGGTAIFLAMTVASLPAKSPASARRADPRSLSHPDSRCAGSPSDSPDRSADRHESTCREAPPLHV